MRRRPLLAALAASAVVPLAGGGAALAAGQTTGPTGPFGFTTAGLGLNADGQARSFGEPSLAVAPDGRHYVVSTPGCGGVCYWYSDDAGETWATSKTGGGGGDSEVDFLPDGTLISADLAITSSVMHRSFDFGKTWVDQTDAGGEQDRQWLAHTADSTGSAAGGTGTQYLVYHDFVVESEMAAVSRDGGKTWTQGPNDGDILINSADQLAAIPTAAGCDPGASASLLDEGVNTFSGPMLVGPDDKDLYVLYSISDAVSNANPTQGVPPFGPTRAVVVAHSGDAGASWTNQYAVCPSGMPGGEQPVNGAIFPWGFIDQAGTVYVVFNSTRGVEGSENFHQYYIYSTDKGASWSEPVQLDNLGLGEGASLYATGDAVSPGVIDVAWYQNDTTVPSDGKGVWTPHFAQVTGADTDSPVVTEQAVTGVPNHVGGICLQGILCGVGPGSSDRSLADFFELDVNPATGMAVIAYADNGGGRDLKQVVVARQTVQPVAAPDAVVPELPVAALAPLAAAGLLGLVLLRRRRPV